MNKANEITLLKEVEYDEKYMSEDGSHIIKREESFGYRWVYSVDGKVLDDQIYINKIADRYNLALSDIEFREMSSQYDNF